MWEISPAFDKYNPLTPDMQGILDSVRRNDFDKALLHVERLAVLAKSSGFTKEVFNVVMRNLDKRLLELATPAQYQKYIRTLQQGKSITLNPSERVVHGV